MISEQLRLRLSSTLSCKPRGCGQWTSKTYAELQQLQFCRREQGICSRTLAPKSCMVMLIHTSTGRTQLANGSNQHGIMAIDQSSCKDHTLLFLL
uniref:Uncharacterized protein n=1 Tax=Setaria italica TaxID=4555 RepID=K3YKG4_SETIT